ncbi:MAG: hypothetical protein H7070_01670 [Saprospiraceae bacterium]|nr:hypothetical protein [Pyrinomonadaceae bacterium]
MLSRQPAAMQAKSLLHHAAKHLQTSSPASDSDLSRIMDASMYLPLGDPAYEGHRMLEPNYTENSANSLSFIMDAGEPGATPADRVECTTDAMSRVVKNHFGNEALSWFRGRSEAASDRPHHSGRWGASFGTALDRNGINEASAIYEWGPELMDSLSAPLFNATKLTMQSIPGVRPSFSSIRCGRYSGTQQVTLAVESALPLASLQPLMQGLGLGHQHAGLMSACALILGARFTLPPSTSTITLRPLKDGVEFRLDVMLDALPDTPGQILSLLRLQLSERPRSLRGLERWLSAFTPEGYPGPGNFSVLSVWARPDTPARIALFLRPATLESDGRAAQPKVNGTQIAPAAASDSWNAWSPGY